MKLVFYVTKKRKIYSFDKAYLIHRFEKKITFNSRTIIEDKLSKI